MNKIFYHGSIRLFDNFDIEFAANRSGTKEIFVSPCHCKLNSISYTTRKGGYLYTIEIDDSNDNYRLSREWGNDNCQCRAYSDVSGFKILKVEKIEYNGRPVFETECGGIAMMIDRKL